MTEHRMLTPEQHSTSPSKAGREAAAKARRDAMERDTRSEADQRAERDLPPTTNVGGAWYTTTTSSGTGGDGTSVHQ